VWKHGHDWLPKFLPAQVTETLITAQNTSSHTLLVATKKLGIGKLIDCARCSKLQKLLRVTALVKKFVTRFTRLVKHDNPLIDWTITATDIEQAEMDWVTDFQKQLAYETNFELWKHHLELFVDDHRMWQQVEESEHSVWTEVSNFAPQTASIDCLACEICTRVNLTQWCKRYPDRTTGLLKAGSLLGSSFINVWYFVSWKATTHIMESTLLDPFTLRRTMDQTVARYG